MADILRAGMAWLAGRRKSHLATTVQYRRGDAEVEVAATFARTTYEVAEESGLAVGAHVPDFLLDAADLALEPAPGDVIVADGRRYEVMNLSGEGAWRWSDPHRTTRRIHTRDVGDDR